MKRLLPVLMVFGVFLRSAEENVILLKYLQGSSAHWDKFSSIYSNAKRDMYVRLQAVPKEKLAPSLLHLGSRIGNGVLSS